MVLKLFCDAATLAVCERESLQSAANGGAAEATILAWYLRQHDTRRALTLVATVRALPATQWSAQAGRLHLVEAEAHRLFFQRKKATEAIHAAHAHFGLHQDARGLGDTLFIDAMLANDNGEPARRDELLANALAHYWQAGDRARAEFVIARQAVDAAFRNPTEASDTWLSRLAEIEKHADDATRARIAEFHAWCAFTRAAYAEAAPHYLSAYRLALASQQRPMAIMEIANAGAALAELNDHDSALAYLEQGLALAREGGWPSALAVCLLQAANSSRELLRLDAAEAFLREAETVLQPMTSGRLYAIWQQYQGDLCMARHLAAEALCFYERFEKQARSLGSPDLIAHALRGRADALTRTGRHEEARAAALAGLDVAKQMGDVVRQIVALRTLAKQAEGTSAGRREAKNCLETAIAIGADVKDYTLPPGLYAELAEIHAYEGQFERAYGLVLQAANNASTDELKRATDRILALQVRHATERATAEAEQQRKLAEAEAGRAAALEETTRLLQEIARMGQDITADLNVESMVKRFATHIRVLFDAPSVSLWTADYEVERLVLRFGLEDHNLMPARRVSFASETSHVANAFRSRSELIINNEPGEVNYAHIPGTRTMLSALFAPLIVGDQVIGVLSAQSDRKHAYAKREQLIFRLLSAYAAVALANAEAYRKVTEAQRVLEDASYTDPLTGLRNRRYLMQHIDSDIALCLRRRQTAATASDLLFFLVDIDHFKQVNDTHGHAAGDAVLVQMRARLAQVFREADHILRWGGEEFLVVAREASREHAADLAERLRRVVADTPFDSGVRGNRGALTKTCSIGVAAFPFLRQEPTATSWEEIVSIADQSLYAAKRAGRNAWVIAEGATHAPVTTIRIMKTAPQEAIASGAIVLTSNFDLATVSAAFST